MGNMESQLALLCSQGKLLVGGLVCSIELAKGGPMEIPKQPRMMLRQRIALHKLAVGPHCQGQHPYNSLNTESLSWYLPT